MENILTIIVFLIAITVLPILRINLSIIYLLQLKEYRRDRLTDFLSSPEGKRFFLNKFLIAYIVLIILFFIFFTFAKNLDLRLLTRLGVILLLAADSLITLYKLKKRSLLMPKKTKRVVLLFITTALIQVFIFSFGFVSNHLVITLFILLLSPYLIITIVNLLMLPLVTSQKNKILKAAENKMKKLAITSIGVTGSFGKSSVKNILVQILKSKLKIISTPENINTEMGVSDIILKKVSDKFDIFVAEMGAYKLGEIGLLGKIVQHKYGFVTGIGNQHIGLFGSQENIRTGKFEIADSVKDSNGNLYVNLDSVAHVGNDMISYSIKDKTAKAYSVINKTKQNKSEFKFHYDGKTRELETNLLGEHQILNLTGVLACCYDLGIDPKSIKKELINLTQVKGTLQVKTLKSGLTVIDDTYNLSVDGLQAGINFLKHFSGKKYLVIDDIIELGKNAAKVHEDLGRKLSKSDFEKIFLIGKNYSNHIQKGLESNKFPQEKIILKNPSSVLKTLTDGVVLLEGRGAGKVL